MSKSTNGLRKVGLASLAVTLTLGAGVMGAGSASALPGFSFDRLGGEDRYETSTIVADEYAASSPDVILANAQPGFYADALTANYLSGEKEDPILLTRAEFTPKSVLDQLKEDGTKNITVVGGETVVPEKQVDALEAEGYTVTRISGTDRYLTNAEVIEAGGAATNGVGVIATGQNFPDALAAGPISYQGHPLGLSRENNIDDEVIAALKGAGVTKVLIMGGTDAVGAAVVAKLEANGITVLQRFAGADRSETSELAAEWALKNLGFTNKHLGVASGYTKGYGADALAGGPLEGKEKSPMLVTRSESNPDDVLDYLKAHASTLVDGHLFGGPAAITPAAEAEMEAAAQGSAAGVTTQPELLSASIVKTVPTNQSNSTNPAGTYVQYNFDERILSSDFADFKVYRADGSLADAGDAATISTDGTSVVVRFAALTNDSGAAEDTTSPYDDVDDLTLATVVPGAVTDAQGESNPEGDAAIGTTVAPGGGTATTAGVTNAPDLVGVAGFRESADGTDTIVDFTFDEAATLVTGAVPADFQLIPVNGGAPVSGEAIETSTTAPGGGTVPGGNGTTVISVQFAGDLAQATFARGAVLAGTVADTAAGANDNPTQAADVNNGGNTTDPDLVSVTFRPDATQGTTAVDQVLFTFDQDIAAVTTLADFQVYHVDGSEVPATGTQPTPAINPTNARQVVVNFANGALTNASGANVLDGAVTGTNGGTNEIDEVGQSSTSGSTAGQTPGQTDAPDLTDVTIARAGSDIFGNEGDYQATYTFDEDAVVVDANAFYLYLANGTRLVATTCDEGTTEAADNTVTCSAYAVGTAAGTAATSAQIGAAVLGTVGAGAVADQANADTSTTATPGSESNPEGAEATTGGTGTPAA